MPTSFPGAVDDIQNDVSNSTPMDDVHPDLHNQLADAIMAIETEVLAGGGGGEVADGSITSAKIADGTIQAIDLADGAVTSAKILDGTIDTGDLKDSAVTSAKIADSTIVAADMASGAAAGNVGTLSGVLGGTLPSPTMAAGAAAANVGTLGGVLSGTLPSPGMAAGAATTNVGTLGGSLSGTLPNPTLAANSVGASQITDGTVGTAELANANVTNAKLASDTARENLLTNGGFQIWQRGNGPFTGSAYTADRWLIGIGAGSTHSVIKVTAGPLSTYNGLQNTYTHGSAVSNVYQQVNMTEVNLKGQTVSLSAWMYATAASAAALRVSASGTGTPNVATPCPAGSWTRLTATITVPTDATYVQAALQLSASCTAVITAVMLVVGSVPADYAPLHPADDLARCQRYYEVLGGVTGGYPGIVGYGVAGAVVGAPIGWTPTKAVTPTTTKTGTWTVASCTQPIADRVTAQGFRFYTSVTVVGNFETFPADATCAVVGEANP